MINELENSNYDKTVTNLEIIFQELVFISLNIILILIEREIIADLNGKTIAGWVMIGLCIMMLIYNLIFIFKDQLSNISFNLFDASLLLQNI